MQSSGVDYLPILLQIGVVGGFVVFVLFITHYLGPRLKSKKKDSNWECGIESQGDARFPVSIRYFISNTVRSIRCRGDFLLSLRSKF